VLLNKEEGRSSLVYFLVHFTDWIYLSDSVKGDYH